jgi:hypothetical protein
MPCLLFVACGESTPEGRKKAKGKRQKYKEEILTRDVNCIQLETVSRKAVAKQDDNRKQSTLGARAARTLAYRVRALGVLRALHSESGALSAHSISPCINESY